MLVTGGSRGIGKAIAARFAELGAARVAIGYLRSDRAAQETAREVEWVAKLQLLGRMRSKYGQDGKDAPWDDPRIVASDIVWSQLGTGLSARLAAAGQVERLATDAEVAAAMTAAPSDTRAYLRGAVIAALPDVVDAAGWSTVVLDRDEAHGHLEVVHLDDPASGSHPLLDELLRG